MALGDFGKRLLDPTGLLGISDSGLFEGKKNTVTQEAMLTPEQKEAMGLLMQFGQTGQLGDFQAGESFGGSLGDFNIRPAESQALTRISDVLSAGRPQALGTAENTLTGLAETSFDPDDPNSAFNAFRRQVGRATQDASDVLEREAAITGDRFSTAIAGEKADLAGRQSDALRSELGRLFENAQARRLQAANSLIGLAGAEQSIGSQGVADAMQFGGIERALKNAEAQSELNEFIRQRNERLGSIGALESVFSRPVPYGVKSITSTGPSPFSQLLNVGLQAGGMALGASMGGPAGAAAGGQIGGGIGSLINSRQPNPTFPPISRFNAQDFTGGADNRFVTLR